MMRLEHVRDIWLEDDKIEVFMIFGVTTEFVSTQCLVKVIKRGQYPDSLVDSSVSFA